MKYVVLEEESGVSKEVNATWGMEGDKLNKKGMPSLCILCIPGFLLKKMMWIFHSTNN